MPRPYCQKRPSRSLSFIVTLNYYLNILLEVNDDIHPVAA